MKSYSLDLRRLSRRHLSKFARFIYNTNRNDAKICEYTHSPIYMDELMTETDNAQV